jgi:N-acetylglucosamine-6-phosphate deacetylase
MRTYITNGKYLTPEPSPSGKTLIIEDQKIVEISSNDFRPADSDIVIDAQNGWVTPGLIDLHVHGCLGYDTMDAAPEAITAMGTFFASHGVTGFLATTMSMPPEDIQQAIENVARYPYPGDGAQCLGVHLEGPYFNPAHRGAQPERFLKDADPAEYKAWLDSGVVQLVSVAPERPGTLDLMRWGIRKGIEFAVGHSGATYAQVVEAADYGLRQATHTFNGMLGLHHREPGTVGAVLSDDRIFAQLIADGIHVHPAVINILLRAKGIERTILITDAIRATGLTDGVYELGKDKIIVKHGIPRTTEGGLAGSTLTMDVALRNILSFSGLSFQEVLPMATSVPAKAMGWHGKKGVICPGADADLVIFDQDLNVRLTMVSGQLAYKHE